MTQSEINIAIGNKEPCVYFSELREQCEDGPRRYGNITNPDVLQKNLSAHCIPEGAEEMTADDYWDFLAERHKLIAQKIRNYFEGL